MSTILLCPGSRTHPPKRSNDKLYRRSTTTRCNNQPTIYFELPRSEVPRSLSSEEHDGLPASALPACLQSLRWLPYVERFGPEVGRLACGPDLSLVRIGRKIIRIDLREKSRNLNGIQERTEDRGHDSVCRWHGYSSRKKKGKNVQQKIL